MSFEASTIRVGPSACYAELMTDTTTTPSLIVPSSPAEPPVLRPPRTGAELSLLAYFISLFWVAGVGVFVEVSGRESEAWAAALASTSMAAAGLLFAATVVFWVRWQLQAVRNARAMTRETPRFSPFWSVAVFFVPIVHLILPLFALTEIWNASHGLRLRRSPPLRIWAWWVAVVFPTAFVVINVVVKDPAVLAGLGFAAGLAYPAGALFGWFIVRRINARQRAALGT